MVGMALKSKQEKELKYIMSPCYQLFGTVSYGSPLGVNAEVLMVQIVCKYINKIFDLLNSVFLFESLFTG